MTEAKHVPGIGDVTVTDRGFKLYTPLRDDTDELRVYESSNAAGPHTWISVGSIDVDDGRSVELDAQQHQTLIRQLQHLAANHYQGRAEISPNELDLCGACHGSGEFANASGALETCRACSGELRGPRRFDIGSEQPDHVLVVADYTAEGMVRDDPDSWTWSRVSAPICSIDGSVWKGYKNGGKVYLDWPELLRRWGPLAEVRR